MNIHPMRTDRTDAGDASARVQHAAEQVWYDVLPNERHTVIVSSRDVGGAFAVVEAIAGPGAATPLHCHRERETFRILEGVLTFAAGDEVFDAAAGATVAIPAGVAHAWRNRSAAPARMLVVFAPGGVEEMFAALAGLSPDEVAGHAETFGTVIVGPPLAP